MLPPTHKRRASLPPQPSADLIAPEIKPKSHSLADLVLLSPKLEKWGKLIEMYLAQRSLIIQVSLVAFSSSSSLKLSDLFAAYQSERSDSSQPS